MQDNSVLKANDTSIYDVTYLAHHWDSIGKLSLVQSEVVESFFISMFVFATQILMMTFVSTNMRENTQMNISLPDDLKTLAARFIAALLMHMMVAGDVVRGISKMKYALNH